jgi:tryptophan 2,3-dioxygenase
MIDIQHEPQTLPSLRALEEKIAGSGLDFSSFLEGVVHTDYLSYWDYIHLDTLLSLQTPRTRFPDELVFITYHQVTELYFKLILAEMKAIGEAAGADAELFLGKMQRVNRYLEVLISSYDVLVQGMEPEQFARFRLALQPASGFQSVQFRMIQLRAAPLVQLVDQRCVHEVDPNAPVEEMYPYLYWNKESVNAGSGRKTLTLQQFEEKYADLLVDLARKARHCNLWAVYARLAPHPPAACPALTAALREFDRLLNVEWAMVHFKSAARFLKNKAQPAASTGGTQWQKYLGPMHQKRIFYPRLWSEDEIRDWGRPCR